MICKFCKNEITPKKGHKNHKYIYCSKSCHAKDRMTTHGESRTKFYYRWTGIYRRCNDINFINYNNYGGRGIKCEWKNYQDFKKDMYPSFLKHIKKYGYKNTSLDRIDNDGNYCKKNCRWATREEQQLNTRKKRIIINGKTLKDLASNNGLNYTTLQQRIKRGWDVDIALKTPSIIGNRYKNIIKLI